MAATTSGASPLATVLKIDCPATAAGATTTFIARSPHSGNVTAVTYVPVAAVTGANTNTRTLSVINKQQGGAGTLAVATLALTSGNNLVAFDENAVTVSGTPANVVVVSGDIFAYASTFAGTGLADPGGAVYITISRD